MDVPYYDELTGWTHLTGSRDVRYQRLSKVEQWLEDAVFDWYRDAYGGLHVRCSQNRFEEILAGTAEPTQAEPVTTAFEKHWMKVTDIGANLDWPALPGSAVLRLLRLEELMVRVDGKDVPTEAAAGLYIERELDTSRWSSSIYPGKEPPRQNIVQRLWAFEVLARLKTLPLKSRKPLPMTSKQADWLRKRCAHWGEPFDATLTKHQASLRIEELLERHGDETRLDDPTTWVSGDYPITEGQTSFLEGLCKELGIPVPEGLSKAAAARLITELKARAFKELIERIAAQAVAVFRDVGAFVTWLSVPGSGWGGEPRSSFNTVAGLHHLESMVAELVQPASVDTAEVGGSSPTPPSSSQVGATRDFEQVLEKMVAGGRR